MTKNRNERSELPSDSTDIKSIRKYYEQLYVLKFNKLYKILKFLERHKQLKHFLWKCQFCSAVKSRLVYNWKSTETTWKIIGHGYNDGF